MMNISRIFLVLSIALTASTSQAQLDGPRVYWPLPKNTNILSVHKIDARLNASLNNLEKISPEAQIESSLYLLTYTRVQPIFERTFFSTLSLPASDMTINIDAPAGNSESQFQHGVGDITWSNTINLIGAPGMMIKDYVRHEIDTVVHFQGSLSFPTGKYDADSVSNIGSNQYKLKLGLPMMRRLGPWVDGKKLVLEVFPSYTLIGDNNDFQGQTVESDGTFAVETHLSRDLTRKAFVSLDYSYIKTGASDYFNNASGAFLRTVPGKEAHLVGATLKFEINDHLSLFLTHAQTLGASGGDTTDLDGSLTKITLSWAWHDFGERFKDFIESN